MDYSLPRGPVAKRSWSPVTMSSMEEGSSYLNHKPSSTKLSSHISPCSNRDRFRWAIHSLRIYSRVWSAPMRTPLRGSSLAVSSTALTLNRCAPLVLLPQSKLPVAWLVRPLFLPTTDSERRHCLSKLNNQCSTRCKRTQPREPRNIAPSDHADKTCIGKDCTIVSYLNRRRANIRARVFVVTPLGPGTLEKLSKDVTYS